METTSSTGPQRLPDHPPSPENQIPVFDSITLPAPPPTRHSEISIPYEIVFPENCVSCLYGYCNQHGQIRESFRPLELHATYEQDSLHDAPVLDESSDDDDENTTPGVFPPAALQSSFFDEEEDESESPSDDDEETEEVELADSDSEEEGNELAGPENEAAEAQVLAAYQRGPCKRLHQR